jgi:glycosyltransferase involved in cell wall biosynthesis
VPDRPDSAIAFVAYFADARRGGQVNLLKLVRGLAGTHRLVVIVPAEGPLAERAREAGAQVEILPIPVLYGTRPSSWTRLGAAIRGLRALFARHAVGVAYVDGPNHVLPVSLASAGLGVRVVWHVQTVFRSPYDRWNVRFADALVCASRAASERLPAQGAPRLLIANGVDTTQPLPDRGAARAGLGLCERDRALLFVGEVVAHKGVGELLDAAARIMRAEPDAVLLVAGEGPPEVEAMFRNQTKSLGERVRWLGHRADVPAVLRAADVFVFPSHAEGGNPLAVLEAMVAGLPVVASDIPAVREALAPDAGVLVEPRDAEALAAAVLALLRDPARMRELGAKARARVEAEHRLELYVSRFRDLFTSLGSGPGARASGS